MNLRVHLVVLTVLACSLAVFANDGPFQVGIAANLTAGESIVNIGNNGASNANICVNVYGFSPDEQLVSCCSCVLTPAATANLGVNRDITSNTLTPAVPSSVMVSLLATANADTCNASAPGPLVQGLVAGGSTLLSDGAGMVTRLPLTFVDSTPNGAYLARVAAICGFIQSNGSGYGICRSCRVGPLGAGRK